MPTNPLKFESARSIAESEPEEPDYAVEQLLIYGAITSFSAKIKAGKTTFVGHTIKCILTNQPIIDLLTRPSKILYCTEEGRKTFRRFLHRTGLEDTEELEVLFLGSVPKEFGWDTVARYVLQQALEVNARIVIFDTLTRWAKIPADKENDPGTAAWAMEQLEVLRNAGIAVMAVFHDRKSGGDVGDSQRGSSAFGGAADILLQLVNPGTNGHPNRRILSQLGRFDDPCSWTVDLNHGTYDLVSKGEDLTVERITQKTQTLALLRLRDEPMSKAELEAAFGLSKDNSTLSRALDELTNAGEVERMGEGKKGDPHRWKVSSQIYSHQ